MDWKTVTKKIKVKKSKVVPVEEPTKIPVKTVPLKSPPIKQHSIVKKHEEAEIPQPKYFPFDISAKIIETRNKFGWTRKDLGMRVNISEIKIANIENGTELYDPKLYVKLKNILDI